MAGLCRNTFIGKLSVRHETTSIHFCQLRLVSRKIPTAICPQWRRLALSASQPAFKNSAVIPRHVNTKSKAYLKVPKATSVARSTYQSYADSLASRASPTLLYEAPSPNLYITGCYVLGAACFAYAGTNFYNTYLNPPEDLSAWIPVMVGGVCIAVGLFGVWAILGAYRIVRTITALPRGSNTTRQPLLLRIDSAEMLPGIRPKSVVVPYQDVILSEFIYTAPTKSSPAELVAAHREEDRWREIAKNNIMTLPFRQASYWMWKGFMLIKNVIWKDDFILVQVIGKNGTFKFDRNSAWALDDGRALDRLVKHRLEDD